MPALTSSPLALIVTAVLAYLVGSIPFGLLLARAMGLGNLREIGSGNIGATNVLRTGSKKAAALTLLLDAVKGAVPVLLARHLLGEDAAQVAGLAAFLGHLFPVWIGFRGGKGVATFLGVVLALAWPVGVVACVTWLVVAYATRYSSLSALVAAALSPVWASVLGYQQTVGLILLLVVLIFLRHHENISRLIAGTESRIGAKK
ncbi:glycerol-3-phosphate 1-O-acyltransferase PlsY [Haematobacter genomosp. 1]|uniref:Glycerol-3-phosphate acyltransferase n=1 Tax=Haematobacter genomosp. 1 TaxID=366618 RepID=A0A212AAD4_9RHOB|nr:glycerol-3-phosphate 1-O-acyltransferase PlsY [Haematobacter genomosp. 1]OWJ77077.1 glycerol-3-phosphate acyltransferase [Haematobacter genomosp. 1]